MGISTPWICLPASLSKTRYCASLHPTRNATQWLPKWLLNSLSLHNRMTCELSTRRFYPERPEKSLETPPQCLQVIDQKWPLVVLDCFSEKWTWHLSNRISCKPSSTPNRSDLIDWKRMLTYVNLKKTGMACRNIVIKSNTRCFKSALW